MAGVSPPWPATKNPLGGPNEEFLGIDVLRGHDQEPGSPKIHIAPAILGDLEDGVGRWISTQNLGDVQGPTVDVDLGDGSMNLELLVPDDDAENIQQIETRKG